MSVHPSERLGEVAMSAIDALSEYGDDAQMEDAFLIMDVTVPDPETGELTTEYIIRGTTHRATVALGLAQRAVVLLSEDYVRDDEDDEDEEL